MPNLLSAANLFQLIPLRDGCAEFMMNHVTVANCIGVFFFAKAHHCNVLALKAKEIINNKVGLLDKRWIKLLSFVSFPSGSAPFTQSSHIQGWGFCGFFHICRFFFFFFWGGGHPKSFKIILC